MKTFRTLSLALLLMVATSLLAGTAAAAAGTRAQTVRFTSAAPTGKAAIWDRSYDLGDYVPRGTASSGLPVYFSVSTPDLACYSMPGTIDDPDAPGVITIWWNSPGTCIVTAEQPGNAQYAPARSVTQVIKIGREIAHITAPPVSKHGTGASPSTFTSTMMVETQFGDGSSIAEFPLGNAVVDFKVGGSTICSATTNNNGVATCTKAVGTKNALRFSYTAAFAGNYFVLPVSANGFLH
ncbi:MAG: hypothetical protein ACJ72E_11170 [Marmoricola sp.]